jgi:hypothetical protein
MGAGSGSAPVRSATASRRMKTVFALILIVHGLIHLMGFVKAFHPAAVPQLASPISRTAGMLWLVASALFLATAVLLFSAPTAWWMSAVAAIVISQALIMSSWSDARHGTIANAVVAIPLLLLVLAHAPTSFRSQYRRESQAALRPGARDSALVTSGDLERRSQRRFDHAATSRLDSPPRRRPPTSPPATPGTGPSPPRPSRSDRS